MQYANGENPLVFLFLEGLQIFLLILIEQNHQNLNKKDDCLIKSQETNVKWTDSAINYPLKDSAISEPY
jgi:hypothetical protein